MTLSITIYATLIKSNIQSALGSSGGGSLDAFCTAVATGVVNTAIGLTGQIAAPAGTGASTGTGITLSGSGVASGIIAAKPGSWPGGSQLSPIATAIGNATATHFGSAILTSDANGTAAFASFLGAISSMASAIQAAASFSGGEWANFCTALATGICNEIGNNGSGTLSGAAGPGAGSGVVTIA